MSKELQTQIRALAFYQIIGGLIGIGLTFFLIDFSRLISFLTFLVLPVVFGLYAYSVYCGIVLLYNVEKGLNRSKINQYLQVIFFAAFGYGYQYASGGFLSVGIDLTNLLTFTFNFGISTWKVIINTESPDLRLSLNLVAIFLLVFINKASRKIKNIDLEQQFSFEHIDSSMGIPDVQIGDASSNPGTSVTEVK